MKQSKRFIFLICVCLFVFATSCSAATNAEETKLAKILGTMNFSSKNEILNNKNQFLQELKAVLDNDSDFLLVLVDKTHFLQPDYVPEDLIPLKKNDLYNISRNDLSLRIPVEKALQVMSRGAKKDGITLLVSSTYRSYDYQKKLFARYVAQDGEALAERYSARAGTSQHQLGTAIDFGSITDEFAETKQGRWLYDHAAEYGFSLSFPAGYEDVTGYMWECWHYRYIGKEACALQKKWFGDIQQYMMEFIDAWTRED
ncbi:MAG: M15 family metallopeptidase [Spirochaetaceae bacterium]|nr:M15 family metallopeptidase [Spirochaetaceae bacterium]